jgi:hypothetical protein
MITRASFSQYLIGSFAAERPPFLYAYAAMWLHLAVGAALLRASSSPFRAHQLASVGLGSFCLAIVVYGAVCRARGLWPHTRYAWLNIGSYIIVMGRAVHPTKLDALLQAVAIVTALASAYLLLAREYRCYLEQTPTGASTGAVPAAISIGLVLTIILLGVAALYLS